MGLDECSTDMRAATELDYYLCAVWVTKENKFTPQEASGSFTLLANLFAHTHTHTHTHVPIGVDSRGIVTNQSYAVYPARN